MERIISHLKKLNPYYVLPIIIIFGYWQISFLTSSLKWDLIDVVFPFRFYFSESIQSGFFPFWNPYLQTGTPFFADLQAPTFYPELLFTSLFSGYGIYTMHFLFVFYIVIAATGMYQLSFFFNKNLLASLLAGISYSFSGYIIGHGQHFFLLVGAAWIPFVIVNYLQLNQNRTFFNTLKTAVFIFLMVSGAYQALSFTLLYLLILIFFFFLISEISQRNFKGVREFIKVNLYLLLIVVVFSLPLIISTFEIITSVDRLERGVTLSQTSNFGQSLKSVVSFVLPFSTLKYDEFFGGVDISMRNHYFGLIPFFFFIVGIFHKRPKLEYLILGFGLIIMASSFSILPVREFMFKYIPLMNLFKYAAFIRVFGLLAFILLAANYMATIQANFNAAKKKMIFAGILVLSGLLFLILYSTGKITSEDFKLLASQKSISELLKNLTFYQHVLFQAIIQFLIAAVFLLIIIFHDKVKYPFHLIVVLFIAEILFSSQLNIPATVADIAYKPYRMKSDLALNPEKFPIPVNDKVIFNDQMHELFQPFWRNTYVFSKQISFNSFSSFELKSFSKLDDDFPNLKNAVLNNHLFYFSDMIFPLKQFNDSTIDIQKDARSLYFSDEDFKMLSGKVTATDSTGTTKIVEFLPNKVVVETNTKNDQFFTMLQTNFKGWKAFIDESKTSIYTSNFNYRTIFLPKGEHTIRYEYSNDKILILYIISNILFFIAVLFLLGYTIRKNNLRGKSFVIVPLTLLFLTGFFLVKRLTYENKNLNTNEIFNKRWEVKNALFHYGKNVEDEMGIINSGNAEPVLKGFKITSENEYFTIADIPIDNKKPKEGTLVVRAKIFPESYSGALFVSDISGGKGVNTWHASKIERQIENLNQWNEVIYFRNFYELSENEVIKVFIWNLNKTNFGIDNITVDFYPLIKK
jgi:hypothetical protein